ncbi:MULTISPECIES: MOSC domain-containing protein [Sutcliffiella]|uniref:MOSC domain-containing protein n=1 Tax=Sutcliffiella cohnii TaxID=33932 RepID=A0A223KKF7_9BACI|nr:MULTISPECIES: MOSC domain-containing protein [Sutcliffiella]AST89843.1 MOSC domain-containing protein [Sutcliffiella cohnii]WBL15468.1 MOSC domain-containing protein [Sutcliffiella sp. NC1]
MKELIYFSIGKPKKMEYGDNKEIETGICKETVEDALLTKDGFIGDGVANTKFHGGPDRAVCVYPYEHYSLWEKEFGQKLPPSAFGENVTVTNMLEKDVHVGDVFQLGEAVIQITQGRIPCSTISKRNNNDPLLKRMVETGYTGYLCRVLQEGKVRKDSSITLLESHPKQLSVLFGNELYFHRPSDVEGMKRMLEVEEMAEVWKEKLRNRINAAMS